MPALRQRKGTSSRPSLAAIACSTNETRVIPAHGLGCICFLCVRSNSGKTFRSRPDQNDAREFQPAQSCIPNILEQVGLNSCAPEIDVKHWVLLRFAYVERDLLYSLRHCLVQSASKVSGHQGLGKSRLFALRGYICTQPGFRISSQYAECANNAVLRGLTGYGPQTARKFNVFLRSGGP